MQFGDYRVEIVPDAEFRLDGGAMFGVVPRTLWSRVSAPDEHNRVRLTTNCLYVEAGGERILVETGLGDKWSSKQAAMYGIERRGPFGESLRALTGCAPEDVTVVINTHLHFDHAGGNTLLDEAGRPTPAFPNARYFVSREEYEHAEAPHERDRASYLPENWRPLAESSPRLGLRTSSRGDGRACRPMWQNLHDTTGLATTDGPGGPTRLMRGTGYMRLPGRNRRERRNRLHRWSRPGRAVTQPPTDQ